MIILLPSFFDIYKDAYFSSEFIIYKVFAYVCLTWCSIFYCRCQVCTHCILYHRCSLWIHCNIEHDIVLQIILCLFYDMKCISITCMNISVYMLVCYNYIFIDIFGISFNFLNISRWIFLHKCIVYTVFSPTFPYLM